MAVYGVSDIRQAMVISGVPVTVGAVTVNGLEDAPDERMTAGEFAGDVARARTVIVETGSLALASGASITVNGVGYKVIAFEQLDDGGLTRVALGSVT